ncbi:MAG: hypothetical protein AAGF12_33830 [Myxococcota bacterium]
MTPNYPPTPSSGTPREAHRGTEILVLGGTALAVGFVGVFACGLIGIAGLGMGIATYSKSD